MKGYSLTELIVVIAIIGVLSALLIPRLGSYQTSEFLKQAASQLQTNVKTAQGNAVNGVRCGSSSNPVNKAKSWQVAINSATSYQLLPDCENGISEPVFSYNLPNGLTFKSVYFEKTGTTCGAPLGSRMTFANISGKVDFTNVGGCNPKIYDKLIVVLGSPSNEVKAVFLNISGTITLTDPITPYPTLPVQ